MIRDERMVADVAVASGKGLDWWVLGACCGVGGLLCMVVTELVDCFFCNFRMWVNFSKCAVIRIPKTHLIPSIH